MLEAGLEFLGDLDRVVAAFSSLPMLLRPVHFSHEEKVGSSIDCIGDQKRFATFAAKSQSGFFLLGFNVTYSIRIVPDKSIICDCFIDVEPGVAKQFLSHMAEANPIYGFACVLEEREHRNRVTTKQGANTIESWVGRNTQKYIPGFYWLTLVSDTLMKQHNIPLSTVEKSAREHIELAGGQQHLFRFYDHPDEWQASGIAGLSASLPGVFDIEKVKPQLLAASNFLELNALLQNWK